MVTAMPAGSVGPDGAPRATLSSVGTRLSGRQYAVFGGFREIDPRAKPRSVRMSHDRSHAVNLLAGLTLLVVDDNDDAVEVLPRF